MARPLPIVLLLAVLASPLAPARAEEAAPASPEQPPEPRLLLRSLSIGFVDGELAVHDAFEAAPAPDGRPVVRRRVSESGGERILPIATMAAWASGELRVEPVRFGLGLAPSTWLTHRRVETHTASIACKRARAADEPPYFEASRRFEVSLDGVTDQGSSGGNGIEGVPGSLMGGSGGGASGGGGRARSSTSFAAVITAEDAPGLGPVDDLASWRALARRVLSRDDADDALATWSRESAVTLYCLIGGDEPDRRVLRELLARIDGRADPRAPRSAPKRADILTALLRMDDPELAIVARGERADPRALAVGPEGRALPGVLDTIYSAAAPSSGWGGNGEVGFWKTIALGTQRPEVFHLALQRLGPSGIETCPRVRERARAGELLPLDRLELPLAQAVGRSTVSPERVGNWLGIVLLAAMAAFTHLFPLAAMWALARAAAPDDLGARVGLARLGLMVGLVYVFMDLSFAGVDLLPDAIGWVLAAGAVRILATVRVDGRAPLDRWAVAAFCVGAGAAVALEHLPGAAPWAYWVAVVGLIPFGAGLCLALRRLFLGSDMRYHKIAGDIALGLAVALVVVNTAGLFVPADLLAPPADGAGVPLIARAATAGSVALRFGTPALLLGLLILLRGSRVDAHQRAQQRLRRETEQRQADLALT